MTPDRKRYLRITGMTVLIFLVFVFLYGYFVGRFRYQVHNQDISFYDLPAEFDGYRIVQFTDMHVGSFTGGYEIEVQKIVDLINQQRPDLIVFTGDLVNRSADELAIYQRMLSGLSAPDGVLSVLGNHDYAIYKRSFTPAQRKADKQKMIRYQKNFGWNLLLNENVKVERGHSYIYIIGVENQGYTKDYFPRLARMDKAMKGIDDSDFKILLSHDPTHWHNDIAGKTNIQLTLSGHTHAGHFTLFGWSPVSWVYPEWLGVYLDGSQVLNVSGGVGGLIPFRIGALPEINVITLHLARQ